MSAASLLHSPVRPQWLAQTQEDALDPHRPVVDAHHHLYDRRPELRYLFEDLLTDLACGHNIAATVYVQARAMLRATGPESLKPVGETEFANGVAAMSASGMYGSTRVCAAIVSYADLLLGDDVRPVLEAHVTAGGGAGGRFRGVRHGATWDRDASLLNPAYSNAEDMLASARFRAGFGHLGKLGLSFDAWLFFHQIPRLTALARAFPDTTIVLDHCGGILGVGPYEGRRDEVFRQWKLHLGELASCPNVFVKVGGLGMKMSGFRFEQGAAAPSSAQLAEAWRPWVETCVEAFGASRCMFESNFPVDKGSYSYGVGLNAMKRLFADASEAEREAFFYGSASRCYRIEESSAE